MIVQNHRAGKAGDCAQVSLLGTPHLPKPSHHTGIQSVSIQDLGWKVGSFCSFLGTSVEKVKCFSAIKGVYLCEPLLGSEEFCWGY